MPRETNDARRARALEIARRLDGGYPDATTALRWSDPWELLVATILSAQCTDEKVNEVTERLFRKYRGPAAYARADLAAFERDIHSTGFFRAKAKSVTGAARMLMDSFGGKVPQTMEELTRLPGVARKTANVVLGTAFGAVEGIVVDTHVLRLADRLGLCPAGEKNAEKVERALMDLLPRDRWIRFAHALVWHGRRLCMARNPQCPACFLRDICPRRGVGAAEGKAKAARSGARKPARSRRRT
ncbi:MAG: endonuclease III [Planctomycetes bacterium]|nr:endonuclease III [Planctomycetota bacterium]